MPASDFYAEWHDCEQRGFPTLDDYSRAFAELAQSERLVQAYRGAENNAYNVAYSYGYQGFYHATLGSMLATNSGRHLCQACGAVFDTPEQSRECPHGRR